MRLAGESRLAKGWSATWRALANLKSCARFAKTLSRRSCRAQFCAAALPVLYADQMLGVLYVESATFAEFTKEEMQLLRTLADLFAGALHNAITFQKAQEQAITDGLTNVKTHRFLMEALSAEWKRSTRATRQFALVLMDLDRFKFVNDFYGHLEGDVVLQRVAHILEQNCRRSDVVARYGGDEFVILMPETSIEQARQLASKLRGWVASDPLLRDKNITASFGIAGFPIHGSTPQELIQVADSSMYLSKHQGGNAVSTPEPFDPGKTKLWKQDVLEAYLGVALKRQFTTGPEAFDEIRRRIEQFTRSLAEEGGNESIHLLPPTVVETVTSLAHRSGCQGSIHARAFAKSFRICGSARCSASTGSLGRRRNPACGAPARRRQSRHSRNNHKQVRAARRFRMGQ